MFVNGSQKFRAHLEVPFVVFPFDGDVIVHSLAQPHDTFPVEGEEISNGISE